MSDLMSGAEGDVESALSGGQLEQCYLLILPPASPAGGAAAAALAAAGIAAEDVSSSSSSAQSAESTLSGSVGSRISFTFNPLSYTVEKSAEWVRFPEPGAYNAAVPSFRGSGPRTMSVEVLLDESYTTTGSVQDAVDQLIDCCKPTMASMLFQKPMPPFCIFGWGSTLGFLSFMKSVRVEYQLFRPDGTPIRANCSLTLEEIPMSTPSQNPTSGGIARRTRTVVAGDTLQSIAFKEYGKPTRWRAIAEANGIDDPTRIANGRTLVIPPASEAAGVG